MHRGTFEKIKNWVQRAIEINSGYNLVMDFFSTHPIESERIVLISIGKASLSMARACKELFGEKIKESLVVSNKEGEIEGLNIIRSSHPYPDERSFEAGKALLSLAERTQEEDLVIFLISGGASSLTVYPHPPFTLKDLDFIYRKLILSGASIHEINAVRRHISLIKGGRLAMAFYPSPVLTLAISDVRGDLPEDIGSGPTVPDPTTLENALEVLKKYGLSHYAEKLRKIPETPKPGARFFQKNSFKVLANTLKVLKDISKMAEDEVKTMILTGEDGGEAKEAAKVYSGIIYEITRSSNPAPPPLLLLAGGELTVTVRGKGKGGRNTEFLLALLMEMENTDAEFCAASLGTDGIDGPTDAAGAYFCSHLYPQIKELNPKTYLENNDSYTFFEKLGLLIKTGPTDTNLRDVRVFWIRRTAGH